MRRATNSHCLSCHLWKYFNPRSPWGERRAENKSVSKLALISIHALREESDDNPLKMFKKGILISIHALREESDFMILLDFSNSQISIHALREESDRERISYVFDEFEFQSTLSVRRATGFETNWKSSDGFQSTLSVRRATFWFYALANHHHISIHALREESDSFLVIFTFDFKRFQSTLSVRRATTCNQM